MTYREQFDMLLKKEKELFSRCSVSDAQQKNEKYNSFKRAENEFQSFALFIIKNGVDLDAQYLRVK